MRVNQMKYSLVVIGIILLSLSSCSGLLSTQEMPVYTPLPPTMTPDPCGPASIYDDVEMIRGLLGEFQEVAYVSSNTPRESLITPIIRLEEIRHELNSLILPYCMQDLKSEYFNYTASLLRYYTNLMNKNTADNAEIDLNNSEAHWKTVQTEFEELATIAGLEFQPLANADSVLLNDAGSKAIAVNEGNNSINIRELPDLNAKVVSTLEPGVQAIVIGRTETGDWIRVNILGTYGWISKDMVVLNVEPEKVDIVNSSP
jgi:hypothetical protein